MPISDLSVLVPLAVSGVYVAASQLRAWARRRSDARRAALGVAGVSSMEEWRRLPTEVQAAADEAALADAQDAARMVADRAALEAVRINTLHHP
ncbi:hypothetical protein [Streptomyces sp. NPDC048521]|uniref:hypothetical protein n=1 Tax=Streptomyces sp. NPDC048521 TaxID=3365566 RepID=UPI0037151218